MKINGCTRNNLNLAQRIMVNYRMIIKTNTSMHAWPASILFACIFAKWLQNTVYGFWV